MIWGVGEPSRPPRPTPTFFPVAEPQQTRNPDPDRFKPSRRVLLIDRLMTKLISIGTNLESSAKAVDLAARYPNVYAVVGWHPCEAMDAPDDIRAELTELARQPKVVAIRVYPIGKSLPVIQQGFMREFGGFVLIRGIEPQLVW